MFVILVSLAAFAAPVAETPTVTPDARKEVKICRRLETTGSRIPDPPVCKTAREWRLAKDEAERMLEGRRDLQDVQPAKPTGSQ